MSEKITLNEVEQIVNTIRENYQAKGVFNKTITVSLGQLDQLVREYKKAVAQARTEALRECAEIAEKEGSRWADSLCDIAAEKQITATHIENKILSLIDKEEQT